MQTSDPSIIYARECVVRDAFADALHEYRPLELEISRESLPGLIGRKRADLFTVDRDDVLRVWEFKLRAGPDAIGQVLVYLALCRKHYGFNRVIRPVLAAAEIDNDVRYAVEALHLGIELVQLPVAVLNDGHLTYTPAPSVVPAFNF